MLENLLEGYEKEKNELEEEQTVIEEFIKNM